MIVDEVITQDHYKAEALFIEGSWQLKKYPYNDGWNSLILHYCDNNKGEYRELIPMWRLPHGIIRGFTDCPRCREEMPEGILGIWKLHNLEQIQQYSQEYPLENKV